MYFEAIRWALGLTDADITPRPFPGAAAAAAALAAARGRPNKMPYDSSMLCRAPRLSSRNAPEGQVAEQLNRILASKAFRQTDRLKRFLSFIVEETNAGRGERLKEFVVGVEVFGKPESFDPRNDPIVRVQARRLRAQLARYYREEAPDSELLIELPKGGYAPVFEQVKSAPARRSAGPALVGRNTVAVLPFADHSAAGDQKYFCEGSRRRSFTRWQAPKKFAWWRGMEAARHPAKRRCSRRRAQMRR